MLLPFAEMTRARAGGGTLVGHTAVQHFSSCSRRIKGSIVVSVASCRSSFQGKFSDGSHCRGFGREGYGKSDLADNPVGVVSHSAINHSSQGDPRECPFSAEEPPMMLSEIKEKACIHDQGGPPPHFSRRAPKWSVVWQFLLPRVSAWTLPESKKHRINWQPKSA